MTVYVSRVRCFLAAGLIGLVVLLVASLVAPLLAAGRVAAQGLTPTPLSIVIPTRTPTAVSIISPTPSRTPTTGITTLRAEARDRQTGANLRSGPGTDTALLGKIFPGQFYAVVGRYGKWLQIQYEKAPGGLAWVYEDIVNLTGGNPTLIPTIDLKSLPTADLSTVAIKLTSDAITATPGAPQTATALQRSATGIFTRVAANPVGTPGEPLPTFTYPPPVAEATLPARTSARNQGGIPPVVPIIGLAVLGMAGLFIASLRRGR